MKSVWGERNHVKRLSFRCRYEAGHEAGHPYGGGDFELLSKHRNQICRIYFRPVGDSTTQQKELVWSSELKEPQVICEDAQPGRWYHIKADLGLETIATITVDGSGAGIAKKGRYPFKSVFISNYSAFTSRFADIEIEYDREPISPNLVPVDAVLDDGRAVALVLAAAARDGRRDLLRRPALQRQRRRRRRSGAHLRR